MSRSGRQRPYVSCPAYNSYTCRHSFRTEDIRQAQMYRGYASSPRFVSISPLTYSPENEGVPSAISPFSFRAINLPGLPILVPLLPFSFLNKCSKHHLRHTDASADVSRPRRSVSLVVRSPNSLHLVTIASYQYSLSLPAFSFIFPNFSNKPHGTQTYGRTTQAQTC